jgi:hypothetical protein
MTGGGGPPLQLHDGRNVGDGCGADVHEVFVVDACDG